jgi:branched-chain amino acid transport system ATP-binding protein
MSTEIEQATMPSPSAPEPDAQSDEPLLDVENLNKSFGGLIAIGELDLKIKKGQIYSIIGPNGAGKTTVFNVVTGIYRPNRIEVGFLKEAWGYLAMLLINTFLGIGVRHVLGLALGAGLGYLLASLFADLAGLSVDGGYYILFGAIVGVIVAAGAGTYLVLKGKRLGGDLRQLLIGLSEAVVLGVVVFIVLSVGVVNPLTNHGFEDNLSGWSITGTASISNTAYMGNHSAQVGSTSPTDGDSTISVVVTVPFGATSLSFWYQVHCTDVVEYDWATATLRDMTSNTTPVTILPNTCTNTNTWEQVLADVKPGDTYLLTLVNHDDNHAGDATYTLFDNVMFPTYLTPVASVAVFLIVLALVYTTWTRYSGPLVEPLLVLAEKNLRPYQGKILLNGRSLIGLTPDQILRQGVARTFQNIRLFNNMTVLENVLVGQHTRLKSGIFSSITRLPTMTAEEAHAEEKAIALLRFFGEHLVQRKDDPVSSLSYADKRRVEIARALASDPVLLLLDEPTAGMNDRETEEAVRYIRRLRDERGITILLIEHKLTVTMGISDWISVLDYGRKIAEGLPDDIRRNERVIEAYLGRKATVADA